MSEPTKRYRALLLDDDPFALELLKTVLSERFPELALTTRQEPDPSGEFEFYFLDDDFEGVRLARQLARRIRTDHPEAIVVAFSAGLGEETLRDLLDAGCAGVCDKQVPEDLPEMLAALRRGLEELNERNRELVDENGRPRLLRTFRALFQEWNRRLDSQDPSTRAA